ncbi:MAG: membrane protein [Peptococcaceae bacterium BICA1-8]|nr:MAG: membrane protein [Peptococcaceae bacterium BICA1-8]
MKPKELFALFILAVIWGASFLFIRIVSPVLGPFLTVELRVVIAFFALYFYSLSIKKAPVLREYWKQYLIIGALNAAIPFTLIAAAALNLNASITSILNSLTPLFAVLVAWGWLKEKLTIKKCIGILLGSIGVIILVGWSPLPLTKTVILSALLSVSATISYAFAGTYAKKVFAGFSPLSVSIGQQLGAALVLLPFSLFFLPQKPVTSVVVLSMIGLSIFCTAIAYLLYYYLLANVGPTKTLSVTFLVPIFGTLWGVIFLKETITQGMLVGFAVILLSILLISEIPLPSIITKQKQKIRERSI